MEPAPKSAVIDEFNASYRGVEFFDRHRDVVGRLGQPPPPPDQRVGPLRREDDSAPVWDCKVDRVAKQSRGMRYMDVYFGLDGGQVCDFTVIEDGAATQRGVAIGDDLDDAEKSYPGLQCGIANEGTEYRKWPYCAGRIRKERYIWFGGDPINTIQLNLNRYPGLPRANP